MNASLQGGGVKARRNKKLRKDDGCSISAACVRRSARPIWWNACSCARFALAEGQSLEIGLFLSSPPEVRRGNAAQRYGGGLKNLPVITIQVFRVELFEFATRNAWLRVIETTSRTTPALAAPSPTPPQPRRGTKMSNFQALAEGQSSVPLARGTTGGVIRN